MVRQRQRRGGDGTKVYISYCPNHEIDIVAFFYLARAPL